MRIKIRAMFVMVLLGCVGLFAGTVKKEFRKQINFKQGGTVGVHNVNGTITVESWEQESVDIFAEIEVKSRNRKDAEDFMERVKIKVEEHGDRIFVEADYPRSGDGGFFDWLFGRKPQVKITFHVRVPSRTDTDMKSVNGNVRISEVRGDAELRSTNGRITADDMKGSVNAKTTNGGIKVRLTDVDDADRMVLKTTNGGIELIMPHDVQANVTASTVNGGIHTDFSLKVRGKFNSKKIRGTLNGGGIEIDLHTVNGGLRIYEE
jgi:hypothetical protein